MYPKNAASPEPIAIGPVVQISDGAVQTAGCTVRIKPIGVAEGDGGGTTAYSTDGVVLYTPTQAETNYTSFVLIAKKTGCIPASITVITTSSATPGTVLLAPVTHTSAVVPTVTTLTNLPAITANWITTAGITDGALTAAKFAAASLNGKGDWNVGKTGYTLTATTGLGNQTANITGNLSGSVGSVTGSVGSISGVTFPANFGDLTITVTTGRVTVGTNADKTGYSLTATTGLGNQTADITGSLSGSVGSVTGAVGSVTAAVTVGTINANVVTASALAADAVTEIQSGLSTLTAANVNAEVLDVLQTDTFAELGAVPAATSSLKDKLTWLFMWFRNKSTETATQRKLYADDTTTVISTEAVSDDGTTFSKGEAS